MTCGMALIAVDAVVDVARDGLMVEVVGVIAAVASGALEDRIVVGVCVARQAHAARVAMVDGELRVLGVVEGRVRPGSCVVTILATRGEELRLRSVPRIARLVVIRLVASDTCGRQRCVVVIHMTLAALSGRYGVRAGQRKRRVGVIERGVGPHSRVVTDLARCREPSRRMCGIIRRSVFLLMARVAERAVQRVVAVDVTVAADSRRHHVRTRQLESGAGMVECAIRPPNRVVTAFARRRERRRHVVHR